MPTRFKLDENLPRNAAVLLQEAGHDIHTVLAEQLGGNPDPRVFDASQAEERVLVTFDLDFSDIRVYPSSGTSWHLGIAPSHAKHREHIGFVAIRVASS